jgi:glycosyltransferase involved in cell wall biosynthesis
MVSAVLTERPPTAAADPPKPVCRRRAVAGYGIRTYPPPPHKVLHVINGEVYGGAERALDLLAEHLGQFGFEAAFACLKPALFPKVRHARQTPLYEVPMGSRVDLRPVAQLVRIIRREGYTLVYAHTARSAMVASLASKIAGVPLVYHVQSPTSRDTTNRWKNRVNALVERLSLTRASALIAVSASMAEHVRRQGFPEEMISVVPNGVPFRIPIPPRHAAKTNWTLGTVALLRPRKGVDVLLRALAILRSEGFPVRLRAAGPFETPAYERQIKALVEELGLGAVVDWTGFTRDVDAELARMDLFVLPSLFGEGLPLVVLEAMAAGLPVVASRVEGIPEAIRDGRDGLLVEPGDPQDLAAALKRVISGQVDWYALRTSALARHAEHFSDVKMAAGVARVYRRVLGEDPFSAASCVATLPVSA